jgi:hypothetical protein
MHVKTMGLLPNPNSSTLEPDQTLYYHTTHCVIAQQYTSANFVSLHLNSRKEEFGKT